MILKLDKPSITTDGKNLYLDNSEIVRNEILKFESHDDFYFISVMWRRKDHPECPANENARMLANWCIKSIEQFDSKLDLIKDYCNHFGARAYIKPQVRSCKSINRQILKFMADQIDNWDLAYSTLTREIISGYHDSRAKRVILDLDDIKEDEMLRIFNGLHTKLCNEGREIEANEMLWLPTFNGYHIITPGFNPHYLVQLGVNQDDVWHSDNDTILYAVKPVTK